MGRVLLCMSHSPTQGPDEGRALDFWHLSQQTSQLELDCGHIDTVGVRLQAAGNVQGLASRRLFLTE